MDLAIELANTAYARRGEPQDALASVADLRTWLGRVREHVTIPVDPDSADEDDLRKARRLRAAIRGLTASAADGRPPVPNDIEDLNSMVRASATWWELSDTRPPRRRAGHTGTPVAAALAQTAANAIDLLAAGRIRACGAPGCVLLFVSSHPRREWCGNSCGNRVRAARHYDRTRTPSRG